MALGLHPDSLLINHIAFWVSDTPACASQVEQLPLTATCVIFAFLVCCRAASNLACFSLLTRHFPVRAVVSSHLLIEILLPVSLFQI